MAPLLAKQPPLLPYGRQWLGEEEQQAAAAVLRSDWLTQGPRVSDFETALAQRVGARHAVAFSSGTAALHGAYFAAGVGPGDEVVTTPMTFVATANAAHYLGARAVFADVVGGERLPLLNPAQAAEACTPRTRAIVPVDFAGHPCDYDALRALARERGCALIADACHALGATWGGRPVGSLADLTVFSFHPVKHITTAEGGAVTTDDSECHRRLLRFRNHGIEREAARLERPDEGPWYYEMQDLGFNYRLSDLHSALGLAQLPKLDAFVARRRELVAAYQRELAGRPGVSCFAEHAHARCSWHLFPILVEPGRRRRVFEQLRAQGIGVQVHYVPVPGHPWYRRQGWRTDDFPQAETYYARTISLPLFPAMRDEDLTRVVAALAAALKV